MVKVPAPAELFQISDNLDPVSRTYASAQIAIQAIIHANRVGPAYEPVASMKLSDISHALVGALGLLHSSSAGNLDTPRDIRMMGEAIGKHVAEMIKGLKAEGDTSADQIFAAMGITIESAN